MDDRASPPGPGLGEAIPLDEPQQELHDLQGANAIGITCQRHGARGQVEGRSRRRRNLMERPGRDTDGDGVAGGPRDSSHA
jgi:hypothetical protein